ncbi:hypothetical protein GJ744_006522 [Endocarpon pusillum]|uniref:Protein DML1 n=1 Tax=Endocarpon pusillum TaxID=364733 RepID=A0A8H7AR90_9EURO|nr:hypothetical protein GJ744_006522 [Endocarpon pusillum]
MHEIVSLQFGQRSNYLATHFWNIQESYFTYSENEPPAVDHDVHFRGGIGADGSETFTPRTVIYDLKGGFGSLRKYNALYELFEKVPPANDLWQGKTSTQQQPTIEPTDYQKNLDQGLPTSQLTADDVRYWSDFNHVFYHPRSIVQLNEYDLNSQLMPFESWNAGQDLFNDLDKEFGLLDRDMRPFAEECDQLAGIQIFTGVDDAWGGFASSYVDLLRDEYGKTSIWLWGLEDGSPVNRQAETRRNANVARSLQATAAQVSAYIRLSSPPTSIPGYIHLDRSSEWSKSALLCTAVESMTLPTRLRDGSGRRTTLAELEGILNNTRSRTLFDLKAGVVTGKTPHLDGNKAPLAPSLVTTIFDLDYSPRRSQITLGRTPHLFSRAEIWRCMPRSQMPILAGGSDQDAVVEIYHINVPFPQLDTFPDTLFGGSSDLELGIGAALVASSETSTRLKDMSRLISRSIDVDTREALLNDLADLVAAYEEGWQNSSDSGSDQ